MGRLEDPREPSGRTGRRDFSTARQACGKLIVACVESGLNPAGTTIYVLFIPIVFREY
jgi:hypothetical protein